MAYLNLDLDYFTHPKTVRLVGLLGPEAVCLPIKLWCYVAKHHCEQGLLVAYSKQEVESVIGWTGESGQCVDAMVKIGLLDEIQNGYAVHDWLEHAGHLVVFKKRAKSAAKKRWKKYASSIAKRKITNTPNHTIPNLTIPNHTNRDSMKPAQSRKLSDEEFLVSLKSNPAFSHINIEEQLGKMDAWLLAHPGREKTRRFIVNWLNKIDKPMAIQNRPRSLVDLL